MPSSACIRPDDDAASSVAADTRMMQQAQPKTAATRTDATTVRSSSRPIRRVGTMLTTSFAGGADLQMVKERLGHGSISTTEKYLHTLPESDETALDAFAKIRTRSRSVTA